MIISLYPFEQRKIVDTVLMGEANKYHIDVSDVEPRVSEYVSQLLDL